MAGPDAPVSSVAARPLAFVAAVNSFRRASSAALLSVGGGGGGGGGAGIFGANMRVIALEAPARWHTPDLPRGFQSR